MMFVLSGCLAVRVTVTETGFIHMKTKANMVSIWSTFQVLFLKNDNGIWLYIDTFSLQLSQVD